MLRRLSVIVLLLVTVGFFVPGPQSGSAQGQVYRDSMDSPETGLLSTETFDPTVSFAYQNGQFVVDARQPSYRGDITSTLFVPEMSNSRLTIDAVIAGEQTNKYVIAGCRQTAAGEGYHFGYLPATGDVLIWRRDSTGDVNLAEANDPSLIDSSTDGFQIGIDCWTGGMTGIVNGQPVLDAFDSTYTLGRPTIGLGANGQQTDGLAVAFDNLTVVDNGNAALGVASTAVPTESSTLAPVGTNEGQQAAIRDPTADPSGTLSDAFTISLNQPPVVADLADSQDVPLSGISMLPANTQLADFYAELYFTTPSVPVNTSYLVGFCFWADTAANCYDLYLQDNGIGGAGWGFGYDTNDGEYQSLQTGELPAGSVDPTPGATNFLSITVYQGVAILSGNTFDVGAVVALPVAPIAGDVNAEFAFLDAGEAGDIGPLPMSISNFSVWDLSSGLVPVIEEPVAAPTEAVASIPTTAADLAAGPVLPPIKGSGGTELMFDQTRNAVMLNPPLVVGLSGSFTQESDVYAFVSSGISVADFYAVATFSNPSDMSAPLDIGIGFRAGQGSDSGLRFILMSDGAWYVQLPGQDPYANGTAVGYDATPDAANTIEILVQGNSGTVAINGVVLPPIDLSAVATRGDVYLGAGFFVGDTVAGRIVPYSNWWIFPTDILDFPSG